MAWLFFATVSAYLLLEAAALFLFIQPNRKRQRLFLVCLFFALSAQAGLLYQWIDQGHWHYLSAVSIFSAIIWFSLCLAFLVSCFLPILYVFILLLPLAILSLILHIVFPSVQSIISDSQTALLIHIALALLASSALLLAFSQALLMKAQHLLLRYKQPLLLNHRLPAIETMEKILIAFLTLGFVCLTSMVISLFWLGFESSAYFWHKAVFALSAWIIFGIILAAKFYWGWQGQKAVNGTLFGFIILMLSYFGTRWIF